MYRHVNVLQHAARLSPLAKHPPTVQHCVSTLSTVLYIKIAKSVEYIVGTHLLYYFDYIYMVYIYGRRLLLQWV